MNLRGAFLDRLWEDGLKVRFPRLRRWDVIRDQSHIHHTMFTTLAFGAVGVVLAFLIGLTQVAWVPALQFAVTIGLASGWSGGLVGYFIREAWERILGNELRAFEVWDGVLDVIVPVWIVGPLALLTYTGHVPTWLPLSVYGLAASIAYLYAFRPAGALDYRHRIDSWPELQ